MCYAKPGPRCSAHALEQMERAQHSVDHALTTTAKNNSKTALRDATRIYYTTPAGFAALESKIASLLKKDTFRDKEEAGTLKFRLDDCRNVRAGQIAELKANGVKFEEESSPEQCKKCGQFTGASGHVCQAGLSKEDPYEDKADLSTWTPPDVDSKLSEILQRKYKYLTEISIYQNALDSVNQNLDPSYRYYNKWDVTRLTERKETHEAKIKEFRDLLRNEIAPREEFYEAEFDNRGRWTRAFIVTNSNGHVHKRMNCSSCYDTTRFAWLTQFSGGNEDDVVMAAGERACTVCYPSAPVEVLARPTTLFTPEEQARAVERSEREAKRAERAAIATAKAVVSPDGSPLRIHDWGTHMETLKTEHAARIKYVELVAERELSPSSRIVNIESERLILEALASKNNVTVDEFKVIIEPRIRAKKREWS